jgi:Ca2+-binding RTX toxin-like protein
MNEGAGALEILERRQMLAAATWKIVATPGDDIIKVYTHQSSIVVSLNGVKMKRAASAVRDIKIHALSGNDHVSCRDGVARKLTLFAGAGNDVLQAANAEVDFRGNTGDDTLVAGRGAVRFDGGGGNDTADFSRRTDDLDLRIGEPDFDELPGRRLTSTVEVLYGGSGNDRITGNSQPNQIHGMGGNDTILSGDGNDLVSGDDGSDSLAGGDGSDNIHGGAGRDAIDGDEAADSLIGGEGDDVVRGGAGDDLIGNPSHWSETDNLGNDELHGGDGNDRLHGSNGDERNVLYGDAGDDTCIAGDASTTLLGGEGNDALAGGAAADRLIDDAGADRFYGWGGDDQIYASDRSGAWRDEFHGGDGRDYISFYSDSPLGVIVSLDNVSNDGPRDASAGGPLDNVFDDIEIVWGTEKDDILIAGAKPAELHGSAGDDTLTGGSAPDLLFGGDGMDQLDARDGKLADRVNGGDGADIAWTDPKAPGPFGLIEYCVNVEDWR